jgi:predicted dinucleotide-binding enzyme
MARDWNILLVSLLALLCFSANSFSQESSPSQKEVIAILGTGDMGDSFGPRLAELGYKVVYGSRNTESDRVLALLENTGQGATAPTNDIAAQRADVVFLALPWGPMEQIIKSLGDMEGKTVIDLSWPESELADDGYYRMTVETSGAEVIQEWIPKAMVVKAFGTTGTNVIDDPNDAGGPVTIPIASDHRHAKEVTARITAELGMDPVDAGPLRMARNIEAMMELYMVPLFQGRDTGWEFYFRRTNYWMCNKYTGGDGVEWGLSDSDTANLADMPQTQGKPTPCP